MKRSEFFSLNGISLDLAVEAHEIIRGETGQEIAGVRVDREKYDFAQVTNVHVVEQAAVPVMGKPIGSYITIESQDIKVNDREMHKQIAEVFAKKLEELIKIQEDATVLVVGLGNWNATPDALGPKVVENSLVTRHLYEHAPEVTQGLRPVCALSPGVLGITGIETAEIIRGVVDKIKPSLVIAVDALAAANVERIATTIQIANTGINPGSGVGNNRAALNQESLGVPVIAVGVPTVVSAAVIANEVAQGLFEQMRSTPTLYQLYKGINPGAIDSLIQNVLQPFGGRLMVTPKEIDDLITNISRIIANGINMALHPGITEENCDLFLH